MVLKSHLANNFNQINRDSDKIIVTKVYYPILNSHYFNHINSNLQFIVTLIYCIRPLIIIVLGMEKKSSIKLFPRNSPMVLYWSKLTFRVIWNCEHWSIKYNYVSVWSLLIILSEKKRKLLLFLVIFMFKDTSNFGLLFLKC
jgi:hypothetical protein